MLSLTMNDAAARALGMPGGPPPVRPAGLTPGLRERAAVGVERRGRVLTWADSRADASAAPGTFADLTAWECADSSFHLEDFVPVDIPSTMDEAPLLGARDQRTLLLHGLAFTWEFGRLVHALPAHTPVRCVVATNSTNATFRFHQLRAGESWTAPDLDTYPHELLATVDFAPPPERP